MDAARMRQLLDFGRSLVQELDLDSVLDRLLGVAQELTGARYAAIGVLDAERQALERFVTKGIDEAAHRAIGDLPRGRGVLGALIDDPRPLRLTDVGAHPSSYGFPLAHPPMHTFLGVPILLQGEAWGNLYLTEKAGGEAFTDGDEEAVSVLADWAAIAISNARLYGDVHRRYEELARANRGLETTTEIARALGGMTDLERVLELVVKRSRALLQARAAALSLLEGDELRVAAVAGDGVEDLRGAVVPIGSSLSGAAMLAGRTQRFADVPEGTFARRAFGARTALATPMLFRGRLVGVLSIFDRQVGDGRFTDEDERLLEAFAGSASAALATAQSASSEALRRSVEASEQERRRWARELHDETLQELAGVRLLLAGARRSQDPGRLQAAVDDAVGLITDGITNLRGLITELRPASLDALGIEPAVRALVERFEAQSGVPVSLGIELSARHEPDVEIAAYRILQEALTNVLKHAGATRVEVHVAGAEDVVVRVADDGAGFAPAGDTRGFGLLGMRERVQLVGGELDVTSRPGHGTTVRATIPARRWPARPS